jgi:hypothetical protein
MCSTEISAEEKLLQQKICLSTFFLTPLIFKQLKELDIYEI